MSTAEPALRLPSAEEREAAPLVCLVIGMAGSGKTTLMQRLNAEAHEREAHHYVMQLDPAVRDVPYGANIDIRDTVKYKEVMKQYGLGPNGAILTSLNLFATRFDQVLGLLQKRVGEAKEAGRPLKHVFVDTPGQIEAFTWSASGSVITESLAASYPTMVVYVVDTPRSSNPVTFMSNMMYACSIMYRTRLPFLVVYNKTDVVSADFCTDWMTDFDAFSEALRADKSYMSTLTRSMSLVLEEFYAAIRTVGVSAVTGAGSDRLFAEFERGRETYWNEFFPVLQRRAAARERRDAERAEEQRKRLRSDLEADPKLAEAAAAVAGVTTPAHAAVDDAKDSDDEADEEVDAAAADNDPDAAAAAAGYADAEEEAADRAEFEAFMSQMKLREASETKQEQE